MNNLLNSLLAFAVFFSVFSCSVEPLDTQVLNETPRTELLNEDPQLELLNEAQLLQSVNAQSCSNSNPKSRLTNNGTVPLKFIVYSDDMQSIASQSNIQPGNSSGWISFNPGEALFSIKSFTTSVIDSKLEFSMDTCTQLDVIVGSNNTVESADIIDL